MIATLIGIEPILTFRYEVVRIPAAQLQCHMELLAFFFSLNYINATLSLFILSQHYLIAFFIIMNDLQKPYLNSRTCRSYMEISHAVGILFHLL